MADARTRLEALEAVMSALAHPSRRQILMVIRARGGLMTAGDIAGRFHHAWPTISRHLGVLADAGLVVREKDGRNRTYRIDDRRLDVVRDWLAWFDPDRPDAAPAPARSTQKRRPRAQEDRRPRRL